MATIFSKAFAGTGVSLSSSYYKRRFYSDNADAKTSTSRKALSNSALSSADSHALRRAIKELGSFTYDDDNSTNIRNSVSAFIDTYNNLLESSGSSEDRRMQQINKSIKKLSSEYANDLDKIGITVNKDGTLKKRSDLFANADISKFEKLFSKDTDYMQRTLAYAKRVEKRSETLDIEEKRAALLKQQQQNESTLAATTFTTSSGTPAAGVGNNINIVL